MSTTKATSKSLPKKKKAAAAAVADSWEDEISSGGEEGEQEEYSSEAEQEQIIKAKPGIDSLAAKSEGPLAPPPTPSTYHNAGEDDYDTAPQWGRLLPTSTGSSTVGENRNSEMRSPRARPEKQTAVANRMIAGALGIRAPKRTEEQRAYDRAVKEKEIKRRNKEKEEEAKAKQAEERAKAAIWDA